MSDSYRFPDDFCGEQRRPPTRSKDPQPPTAPDPASGTASRTLRATPTWTRRATSPATTTGATRTTSRSWPSSASTPTASALRGDGSSRGHRGGQPGRDSTSTPGSSTSCCTRNQAERDALPLGSSRSARRPRRLAQPRHRRLVRRIRRGDVPRARRPRADVGDAQRAVGRHRRRLPARRARAGTRNLFEAPIATHNLLRSHGAAVERFRSSNAAKNGKIGIVVNLEPKYPASESAEDVAATPRADAYMNRQYLDPVFKGKYPAELREIFGEAWPEWPDEDMRLIKQPIDFLGVNYYTRKGRAVRCGEASAPGEGRPAARQHADGDALGGLSRGADEGAALG